MPSLRPFPDPELQRWARQHFRPGQIRGPLPRRIVVTDLSAKALGETDPTPDTTVEGDGFNLTFGHVLVGVGILGLSFMAGRWWARRQQGPKQTMVSGLELLGVDEDLDGV